MIFTRKKLNAIWAICPVCETKILISVDVCPKCKAEFNDINLKDHERRIIRPCREDRSDIIPKDIADALQIFMNHYGLNNEDNKMGCGMIKEKLYNLICPSINSERNKSYLNITSHDIRDALIKNEIKNYDGVTLIEIENGRARELSIVEISKIVNPVSKTIVTWELTEQSSIVKV
jgi:hypothetical protein